MILLFLLHSSLKPYLSNYRHEPLVLKIAQPGSASHFDHNFYRKAVLVELKSREFGFNLPQLTPFSRSLTNRTAPNAKFAQPVVLVLKK